MAGPARLTILVENTVGRADLRPEHGFAVWVETDAGRVLFDTGQGDALGPNARALGIGLSTADAIVLSHGHYDHTGGLPVALNAAPHAAVYAHPSALEGKYACGGGTARSIGLPAESARALAAHRGAFVETSGPTEVISGLFVTGEVARTTDFEDVGGPFYLDESCAAPDPMLDDQALFFPSEEGIVLVLGCAHAGVVNTMRYVVELTGQSTFACVMGGMHLVGASRSRTSRTIEALRAFDVRHIGPAHCTGPGAVARFRQEFPERLIEHSAGSWLEFPATPPAP